MHLDKNVNSKSIGDLKLKPEPILVFTIDDNYITDYDIAYAEFAKRGIRGTLFICTVNTGCKIGVWGEQHLSWKQILEMWENGWDIQCHSHNHHRLTELTEPEIRAELEKVNDFFKVNSLPLPRHHAFPEGAYNNLVKKIVAEYRLSSRSVDPGFIYTYDSIDLGSYAAFHGDMQIDKDLTRIIAAIEETIFKNGIIVLYIHKIVQSGPSRYECLRSLLEELLDFIISSGITAVTVSEMYRKVIAYRK